MYKINLSRKRVILGDDFFNIPLVIYVETKKEVGNIILNLSEDIAFNIEKVDEKVVTYKELIEALNQENKPKDLHFGKDNSDGGNDMYPPEV